MSRLKPILVFDLDGTLADTAPDLIATLNMLLARDNLPLQTLLAARSLVGAGARALIERGLTACAKRGAPRQRESHDGRNGPDDQASLKLGTWTDIKRPSGLLMWDMGQDTKGAIGDHGRRCAALAQRATLRLDLAKTNRPKR